MTCHTVQRQLYHYQAGELPAGERAAVEQHLAACPECARRLAFEDEFLGALKSRLQRTPAPPDLRARVRAAIREEAQPARSIGWLRSPWLVPLAASVFLALLMTWFVAPGAATLGVTPVDRQVTVVDFECDRAGATVDAQRQCRHPRHFNVLKTGDRYWNIGMDQETARHLVVDEEMRGHVLHVRGELYDAIQTVQLTDYTDLGLASLAASL